MFEAARKTLPDCQNDNQALDFHNPFLSLTMIFVKDIKDIMDERDTRDIRDFDEGNHRTLSFCFLENSVSCPLCP
jgi:hypothetical protein